ncbi:hypothetical protein SAMN05443144_13413 [Fodinibius roseus]|uniref:Uncharacterized protein n=1 Tax=Fodinibius roseus TaxID=1194090 RepID=A0A1M5KV34_9BACT|nr:hypothetical protein SAMN05443144_13413 [Fodinibius roseus]
MHGRIPESGLRVMTKNHEYPLNTNWTENIMEVQNATDTNRSKK